MKEIRVGSLFSGIGGMEIGLSRAIPNIRPAWFCEQNLYSQSILSKHWKGVPIYDDVRNINKSNVESIDILTGGFPCQDISGANKNPQGVKNGKKSGLWWEMLRIIGDLRPRIVIMENVSNVLRMGGIAVVGSLNEIGYCVEWEIVSARQFGKCHQRKRWFGVAYPDGVPLENRTEIPVAMETRTGSRNEYDTRGQIMSTVRDNRTISDFAGVGRESALCGVDDGISRKLDDSERLRRNRLTALGNAIVPDCSEYVGRCVLKSGLLDDFYISAGEK